MPGERCRDRESRASWESVRRLLLGALNLHLWSGLFAAIVSLPILLALGAALWTRFRGWSWWGLLAFLFGWALALWTVLSWLDPLGERGSLSAHVAQHVILGDLVAPLLLLGLAPQIRRPLSRWYRRLASSGTRAAQIAILALSPIGAAALWALATYFWLVPPVHRLAIADGPVHMLDHASFLVFGLLVWLPAFDFRKGAPVTDWETLKSAHRTCDLPWWARHIYAMVTRLAMLPAVAAIWLMPASAYFLPGQTPPGDLTRHEDQVQAASLMLGFEMLLFGLAVVLAFIFVSVSEGRTRHGSR